MAQRKDLFLARRELAKTSPYQLIGLAPQDLVLGAAMAMVGVSELVKFLGTAPPSLPPRRPAPVATGVDRHCREPFVPGLGALPGSVGTESLEKYLLRGLLGFVGIGQQKPAQSQHPRLVLRVDVAKIVLFRRQSAHRGHLSYADEAAGPLVDMRFAPKGSGRRA